MVSSVWPTAVVSSSVISVLVGGTDADKKIQVSFKNFT